MSKMSELSQVLDDLISCGEELIRTANAIRECFTGDDTPEEKAPERTYSKEEIREMLAKKANEGFKAQVRSIVHKYADGGKLTDIPESSYPAVAAEVEGLTDA